MSNMKRRLPAVFIMYFFALIIGLLFSNTASASTDSLSIYLKKIQKLNAQEMPHEALKLMIQAEYYVMNGPIKAGLRSGSIIQINLQEVNISALKAEVDVSSYEMGRAYEYAATRFFLTGDYKSAEQNYLDGINLLVQHGEGHRIYRWLGILYGITQDSEKAIENFKAARKSVINNYDDDSIQKKRLLIIINTNYQSLLVQVGQYKEAKKVIRESAKYALELNEPFYQVVSYLSEATLYVSQQDPINALRVLEKMESLMEEKSNLMLNFYNLKANAHLVAKDYEKARLYFQKSIDIVPDNSVNSASKLVNQAAIASIYYFEKDYERALEIYDKVIDLYLEYPDKFSAHISNSYTERSKVHLELGDIESAYADAKSALSHKDDFKTWKIKFYSNLSSIYAAYYSENNDPKYADSLLWNIKRTDQYIDTIREEFKYLDVEIGLNEFIYGAYANNLNGLYSLYSKNDSYVNLENVFQYFEGIKSYSLKEYLKTDDAVKEEMLPPSIVVVERNFKNQLGALTKKLQLEKDMTSVEKKSLMEKIDALEIGYGNFLTKLEEKYQDYYSYQYQNYQTDLKKVQQELKYDEAIVEYYMSNTAIYIFLIETNKCHFFKKALDENWSKDLQAFLNLLAVKPSKKANGNGPLQAIDFANYAHNLYQLILDDVMKVISKEVEHLIIVGDNQLNFIPFEILLTQQPEERSTFKDLPYLTRDYSISYNSSVSEYMRDQKSETRKNKYSYVGISPDYNDTDLDLPYTRQNLTEISELYGGKVLLEANIAQEEIFDLGKETDILHFGMHGVIDQFNPMLSHLVLSANELDHLYVSDIYASRLNASLVVLSACNTGTGRFLNGDGVQNIARAFRFAGVSSTVMSLWSIPDVQTAQIETLFFKHLNSGERKDHALRMAKLEYLQNSPVAFQHPYYWAGLIPIGDMNQIIANGNNVNPLKYAIIALISLLFVVLFKKNRS